MTNAKSIIERVSGLVAEAIGRLKDSLGKRLEALESGFEGLQKNFASNEAMVKRGEELKIRFESDLSELQEKTLLFSKSVAAEAEAIHARSVSQLDARLASFHEAMSVREALQNDLTGQLKALLQERASTPALQDVVRQCLESFRESDELLLKRCREASLDLLEGLTKASQEQMASLSARLDSLPTVEALVQLAADLVKKEAQPVDLSRYALKDEVQSQIHQVVKDLNKTEAFEQALEELRKGIPDLDDLVLRVGATVRASLPAPDLSGLASQFQVQDMIASATRGLQPEIDAQDLAKAVVVHLPTTEAIAKLAASMVEPPQPLDPYTVAKEAAALIPIPKDGVSVTSQEVKALVEEAVSKVQLPDAKSVADALEGTISKWALDFERRAQDTLQRTVDRLPKPEDGKDGLGFDDLTIEHDGERRFSFVLVQGSRKKQFDFKLPVMLYRGIYDETHSYDRGDVVTWGGSSWSALKEAPQGKPGQSRDWQLIVKKGRDGSSK